ncbi:uncharacterized protein I303_106211 [Kwoniella dejecticola CBS 10117]|uniref:Uncharacterized protein n=1 Tax=Kwoniella dejecticola CBS 10117 TaxID=1296121 RepID=A0A1A6A1K6_9TREE|nr:uncharacterized protein I303_06230 [Kwoniella dejecticola CBS 10117]OBR83943.1 hypothetical protein I303_06230 [Kwoniella dejecticola CBS 10117]
MTVTVLLRRDEDDLPPSPFSYFFPLLLIMIACGGYIYWRRVQQAGRSSRLLRMNFPISTSTSTGIRLSEDGPPATVFTHDNASTDSLPAHALQEIPELQQPSPIAYSDTNPSSLPLSSLPRAMPSKAARVLGIGKSRRSNQGRVKSPIEGDQSDEDQAASTNTRTDRFDIGDLEDESGGEIGNELDPLRNK